MGNLLDESGKPILEDRAKLIKQVMANLLVMTEHERGLVLCWFCNGCHRYVGPGDSCHCINDE